MAGGGLADHLDAGQVAEGEAQPLADHGVVVGDDDGRWLVHDALSAVAAGSAALFVSAVVSASACGALGRRPASGSRAETMLPPPGRGCRMQLPPSSSARSRIKVRPTPARLAGLTPHPSSVTSTCRTPSAAVRVTVAVRAAAWRVTLVTASVAIR